jgi:adenylate kinase
VKRRIVLLGPPASGKGTQAEMITAKYGIPSASPGAMFREEMAAGTELGRDADRLTRHGKLVPDEMVCKVVAGWLAAHNGEFVFDGFPRSLGQADALESMLGKRGTPLDAAIFLEADFETISSRVMSRVVCTNCRTNLSLGLHVADAETACPRCGGKTVRRSDDNIETLQLRMREYGEKTKPLVDHYRERGFLHVVDSTLTPDLVFASISSILEGR